MTVPLPPVNTRHTKAPSPPRPTVAPKPKAPPAPTLTRHVTKLFGIEPWIGTDEGQKIVFYGPSGVGKTTLIALLQQWIAGRAVVLGLDDGGRLIRNGKTGDPLLHVPGVETYQDVRDFLHTDALKAGDALVIDTVTKLEELQTAHILATIKADRGQVVTSIEDYGYGKGYRHLLDALRLVLGDLDTLIRRGVHIVLLAQEAAVKVANPEGLDYIQAGPKLWHSNQYSSRLELCEWADHVLRIGYHDHVITPIDGSAKQAPTKGKITGDNTRAVYTATEAWFAAKSRTLTDPVVSFEDVSDDTIWKLIFGDRT